MRRRMMARCIPHCVVLAYSETVAIPVAVNSLLPSNLAALGGCKLSTSLTKFKKFEMALG